MEKIYVDNAGTTPMAPEVIEVMSQTMRDVFGNASATNSFGRKARQVLQASRQVIADSINAAQANEIGRAHV